MSVLLIVGELARAARIQRSLSDRSITSYWASNTEAGWRALRDVDPQVVVIDHATNAAALSFFSLLADARPHVRRLLLTHVSASLFARERNSGMLDAVVYEHTLTSVIDGLSPEDTTDEPLGTLLPFPRT